MSQPADGHVADQEQNEEVHEFQGIFADFDGLQHCESARENTIKSAKTRKSRYELDIDIQHFASTSMILKRQS